MKIEILIWKELHYEDSGRDVEGCTVPKWMFPLTWVLFFCLFLFFLFSAVVSHDKYNM